MNAPLPKACEEHSNVTPKWNEDFQAHYCPTCRTWLSPRCTRPYCQYCKGRPNKAPIVEDEA